ncbi:hypothetical protein [Psychrobacter ciconiae]|uniref:hypothetical protein n=1 Tax=Psychrobacter ciconiae TaxID=1553449 RepID=UPI0019197F52|nr:hypothetical protein [Psychrobacter ciconiae]
MTNTLKLAAAIPALALLSACATTAPTTTPTTPAESATDVAYDRMAPAPYTCTDGGKIMAKQSINKQQAMLNVTLPKVNWANQPLILNGGMNGDTASYVNDSNPEVIYAWHMKGNEGVLAMKWATGQEYQVTCKI